MNKLFNIFLSLIIIVISNTVNAKTIQIEFTEHDTYSKEVAYIDVGDTIEWLPKYEGHNVQFLAGPNMNSLPKSSKVDAFHSVSFDVPGVYLYHCTPHGNMGMLGLVIVGSDFHNLKELNKLELSSTAKSVLQRLIKINKLN